MSSLPLGCDFVTSLLSAIATNLGKMLYDAKKMDFGPNNDRINDAVIDYIRSLFSIALSKHKGDAKGMQDAILSIVPHAFGDPGRCEAWCRFKENPKRTSPSISLVEKISLEMASGLF